MTFSSIVTDAESLFDAAIPGLNAITTGEAIAKDVIEAATKIWTAYNAPDIVLDAIQQQRMALAAKVVLLTQPGGSTTAIQNSLGSLGPMIAAILFLPFLLCGCLSDLTVKPHTYTSTARVDDSTPSQFPANDSGFVGKHDATAYLNDAGTAEKSGAPITGTVFGVLTANGRDSYNRAMAKYAVQMGTYFNVAPVPANAGVKPYTDEYGNALFSIDLQHLQDFLDAAAIASNPQLYPDAK
jgi:hypothetical protein